MISLVVPSQMGWYVVPVRHNAVSSSQARFCQPELWCGPSPGDMTLHSSITPNNHNQHVIIYFLWWNNIKNGMTDMILVSNDWKIAQVNGSVNITSNERKCYRLDFSRIQRITSYVIVVLYITWYVNYYDVKLKNCSGMVSKDTFMVTMALPTVKIRHGGSSSLGCVGTYCFVSVVE